MSFRFMRARPRAAEVEESLHLDAESHGRRWDDPPPATVRPSKLRQCAAVLLVLVITMAYVVVAVKLWGHHA